MTGPTRPAATGSDPDYAELERLARAATPGPWHPSNELEDQRGNWEMVRQTETGRMVAQVGPFANWEADAAFISALSPDVVLRLLARRAPGDRGTIELSEWARLKGLEDLARELVDRWDNGTVNRPEAEIVDAMARALAADSRPEQPAPLERGDL